MLKKWSDGLIGHVAVTRILTSACVHPAPAYLLYGPSHAGKRTFAIRFVQRLLGCDVDDPKWRMHPDVIVLEAEEGKMQVSVEHVRDARERLSLRPSLAERVVMFVPHADRLNESGTNALLKVVEEPPAEAVFVFVAEDISRIPQTLRSRSVLLPFDIVPRGEIVQCLQERGMKEVEAEARSIAAHGLPGLALSHEVPSDTGTRFAQDFFSASSAGARLARIESLTATCSSEDDTESAWRDAILQAMRVVSDRFTSAPTVSIPFGIALIAALRCVGSAVPPRFPLDALAVRLDVSDAIPLAKLFPAHIPVPMHPLYL